MIIRFFQSLSLWTWRWTGCFLVMQKMKSFKGFSKLGWFKAKQMVPILSLLVSILPSHIKKKKGFLSLDLKQNCSWWQQIGIWKIWMCYWLQGKNSLAVYRISSGGSLIRKKIIKWFLKICHQVIGTAMIHCNKFQIEKGFIIGTNTEIQETNMQNSKTWKLRAVLSKN